MLHLASTFTDSLGRLTADEQKAVKTTAFDMQVNPASPGLSFHKLDRARDKNFWSVRVSSDIRIIVHKTESSVLLCYVDHHDKAYDWAERRKVEVHPTTGAAQLVEVRETVVEIPVVSYVATDRPAPKAGLQSIADRGVSRDDLLTYGVPEEWLDDVLGATDETVLDIAAHLPQEAAEAVLDLATGRTPTVAVVVAAVVDPFAHPDAQRRFRVMQNVEELERALEYPWEKWSVFLHPAQREIVTRTFGGPARVAGTAGTGKTVVALHRAVHLARQNPAARVLVTTFSVTLARILRQKLHRLTAGEPELEARITVDPIDEVGFTLYQREFGTPQRATDGMIRSALAELSRKSSGHSFSDGFLFHEWTDVVDAWRLTTWESYRDVARLGRKTRLGEKQRAALWTIFSALHQRLEVGALFTPAMLFAAVTEHLRTSDETPFHHVVVDEAQDVNVSQLRFLAALAGDRPDGLFFAGDSGQRIFQTPFSWKSLGVDVRGRSHTLRINYRTSHQIRRQADRLLDPEIADVDGNVEDRRNAVSVFNGPDPEIRLFDTEAEEIAAIGSWIADRIKDGMAAEEIGVFVRSAAQMPRARDAIRAAGLEPTAPAPGVDPEPGRVVLLPMHLAKGLEFRAVVTACCDDEVLPLQSRIEEVTDDSDLEEVYNTERHLLYVACTRARDRLLVTGVGVGSEFLGDLGGTAK
jgi:mRNA-degrading endonuclease RelE of RelBE toxin-antitoxin system